jgi:hypothetical protein
MALPGTHWEAGSSPVWRDPVATYRHEPHGVPIM